MKVISYSRVSTNEQANHGVSLDAQQSKIVGYAGVYDLTIVETIVDAGESAKSLKRPGIQRALTMLRNGDAQGLIVAKLDRLTRSIKDWQTLVEDYFGEKAGKQLFSVADSIDTRSPSGRMVLNLLLVVSQWEREEIGKRTKDALRYKISNNERAGRLRFGYDVTTDGKLIPNEREQQAIQLMRQWRNDGWSLRAIADELGQMGIRTKDGKPWSHNSVSYVLKRTDHRDTAA